MAAAAIGTDTGGSVRIPASLCGLVGWKPTAHRVSLRGALPLSPTLDSVGTLARSVDCCIAVDRLIAEMPLGHIDALPLRGLRLAVPTNLLLDALEDHVAASFERTLAILARRGARIERVRIDVLDRLAEINAKGGLPAAEVYAAQRALIESRRDEYDPRVLRRILKGADQSAADYLDVVAARRAAIADADVATAPHDALVAPTTALAAPTIAELDASESAYGRANMLMLRNPSAFNFLDRCAISLPMPADGLPVGVMLVGERDGDARLLAIARAVESALRDA